MEAENQMLDLVASGQKKTTRIVKAIVFIPENKCTVSFFKNKSKCFKRWELSLSLLFMPLSLSYF